jgi:hypothetical protein
MSDRCRVCGKQVRLRADETAGRHDQAGQACPGTGLPPYGDPPCGPACRAVGTIGWPVPYERGKPHASTRVCDSPSHQDEARAWVHGITGHAGVFCSFAEARREAASRLPLPGVPA